VDLAMPASMHADGMCRPSLWPGRCMAGSEGAWECWEGGGSAAMVKIAAFACLVAGCMVIGGPTNSYGMFWHICHCSSLRQMWQLFGLLYSVQPAVGQTCEQDYVRGSWYLLACLLFGVCVEHCFVVGETSGTSSGMTPILCWLACVLYCAVVQRMQT
jgi:hypothetical protein